MIKSRVEEECPGQVSCADIIVLAAREAVAISGGPRIEVPLGRRDSISASNSEVTDALLPSSDIGVNDALTLFSKLGMTTQETVAIMGTFLFTIFMIYFGVTPTLSFTSKTGCRVTHVVSCPTQYFTWILHFNFKLKT